MTVNVVNHFSETVEPYILEQYKDSAMWKSCLAAVIRKLDDCEKYVWDFSRLFDYNDSSFTGDRIDFVGMIFNIPRNAGENDETYRSRLVQSITSKDSGTAENVKRNARFLSGDEAPTVLDEAPGVFFVYTPNGKQIKRDDVQKLAPAGVIGLPGAAIKMGDGSFLGDADGNMILTAAQDDVDELWENCGSEHEITVVDSGEEKLIDDGEGGYIVAYEKLSDTDKFEED